MLFGHVPENTYPSLSSYGIYGISTRLLGTKGEARMDPTDQKISSSLALVTSLLAKASILHGRNSESNEDHLQEVKIELASALIDPVKRVE